ncbi:MAG TPA: hypothetical protein V6D12_05580 [Candidatus Obscuribacterales bacterium]
MIFSKASSNDRAHQHIPRVRSHGNSSSSKCYIREWRRRYFFYRQLFGII